MTADDFWQKVCELLDIDPATHYRVEIERWLPDGKIKVIAHQFAAFGTESKVPIEEGARPQ